MKVQFYIDAKGEHRWRLVARNGRTMADSGEGYTRHNGARLGFWLIARHIRDGAFDIEVLR